MLTVFLFQKRKAGTAPSEEEAVESDDAPKVPVENTEVKVEVQSSSAEPKEEEEKKEEEQKAALQAKRKKATNPYGAWEQIQEEKDP